MFADEVADLRQQVAEHVATDGHLDWIWNAWWRLGDERPHIVTGVSAGMGGTLIKSVPGKVPWTAVLAWCEAHGYGDDDREMMDRCIQSMDAVYLEWWAEKNKPKP